MNDIARLLSSAEIGDGDLFDRISFLRNYVHLHHSFCSDKQKFRGIVSCGKLLSNRDGRINMPGCSTACKNVFHIGSIQKKAG